MKTTSLLLSIKASNKYEMKILMSLEILVVTVINSKSVKISTKQGTGH